MAGETTTAGAMMGAVLLVSEMLVGCLASAAIRMQLAAPGGASIVPERAAEPPSAGDC